VKLGVVSNFDTRLRPLLQALNCDQWFDAMAVSAEVCPLISLLYIVVFLSYTHGMAIGLCMRLIFFICIRVYVYTDLYYIQGSHYNFKKLHYCLGNLMMFQYDSLFHLIRLKPRSQIQRYF
jgi:hypothetical protein